MNSVIASTMFQSIFCCMFPLRARTMIALKLKFFTFAGQVIRLEGTAVSSHPFYIIFKSSETLL